jgi:hypothetical protein
MKPKLITIALGLALSVELPLAAVAQIPASCISARLNPAV